MPHILFLYLWVLGIMVNKVVRKIFFLHWAPGWTCTIGGACTSTVTSPRNRTPFILWNHIKRFLTYRCARCITEIYFKLTFFLNRDRPDIASRQIKIIRIGWNKREIRYWNKFCLEICKRENRKIRWKSYTS